MDISKDKGLHSVLTLEDIEGLKLNRSKVLEYETAFQKSVDERGVYYLNSINDSEEILKLSESYGVQIMTPVLHKEKKRYIPINSFSSTITNHNLQKHHTPALLVIEFLVEKGVLEEDPKRIKGVGEIVSTRSGEFIAIDDCMYSIKGVAGKQSVVMLNEYNRDLTHKTSSKLDVLSVLDRYDLIDYIDLRELRKNYDFIKSYARKTQIKKVDFE